MRCNQCGKSNGTVQEAWICDPGGQPIQAWLHRECEAAFLQQLEPNWKRNRLPDFAVRFVGYGAYVVARKGNADCAMLDFVSGATILKADAGSMHVPKRSSLASAIADLPSCIEKLKALAASVAPTSNNHRIKMRRGEWEISVTRGADIDRLIRQLTKRFRKIEPILQQAEKIGSEIKRRPYADYIDEGAKTGRFRVEFYGDAMFVEGKLLFHPERRTLFTKPTEDGLTWQVNTIEDDFRRR
jgi:hypothetical protein